MPCEEAGYLQKQVDVWGSFDTKNGINSDCCIQSSGRNFSLPEETLHIFPLLCEEGGHKLVFVSQGSLGQGGSLAVLGISGEGSSR